MFVNNLKNAVKTLDTRYFLFYVICISVIALYGKYRCDHIKDHKDVLEFELFKGSKKYQIDGWSISHLLFNALIGYLYPKTIVISMILGGLWELTETYIGIYKPSIVKGYGFCDTKNKNEEPKVWWYGKKSDIFVNLTGFMIGKTIREKL